MIFIDTTVWVGAADENDDFHDSATKIIDAVTSGSLPLALTTDFVIDETVTILGRRKAFGAGRAREVGMRILSSPRVFTVFMDETLLLRSLERYPTYKGKLSLTDVCSVLVMEKHRVKEVYSHDSDFDLPGFSRKERVS